jgi:hypothetical protein
MSVIISPPSQPTHIPMCFLYQSPSLAPFPAPMQDIMPDDRSFSGLVQWGRNGKQTYIVESILARTVEKADVISNSDLRFEMQ